MTHGPLRRWLGALVGVVVSLSGAAHAQSRDEEPATSDVETQGNAAADAKDESAGSPREGESPAVEAFWEAKRLYELGDYRGARQGFERAYQSIKSPELVYDIAQTYRNEGDCPHALQYFEAYARDGIDASMLSAARKRIHELKLICPRPEPEPHRTVSAPGAVPGSSTPRPERPQPAASPHAEPLRWWALAAAGAGLVAGATSIGLALYNDGQYARWKERDRALSRGPERDESAEAWALRQDQNDELLDSVHDMDRIVVIVGIGAGALIVTSAVLYGWSLHPPESDSSKRALGRVLPKLELGKGSLSLSCQAVF